MNPLPTIYTKNNNNNNNLAMGKKSDNIEEVG